jgi:hypothetical protein
MREAHLQAAVIGLCQWLGLLVYHTRDSRGSAAGFPDLVIVGPRGVLFRELKSNTGKTTAAQRAWGQGLTEAGARYGIWTPQEWADGTIRGELGALCARVRGTA